MNNIKIIVEYRYNDYYYCTYIKCVYFTVLIYYTAKCNAFVYIGHMFIPTITTDDYH